MTCSKCEEPVHKALVVPDDTPDPGPGEKNNGGVRIFRFCKAHWGEVRQLLPF